MFFLRAVKEHGDMSHKLSANAGWFVDDYRKSLKTYATALLEAPPDDKNMSQYLDMFKDGKFAEEPDQDYANNFGNNTKHAIYSSTLAYLWREKHIFVAYGKNKVNGKKPCDLDVSQTDNDLEFTKFCEDDTLYVLAAQPDSWGKYSSSWPSVPGVKKLKDWGLDFKTLLKSARWAQKKSGLDAKYWTPKRSADAFKSKDPPPGGYLFNLPVCDMDVVTNPDKYVSGDSGSDDNLETVCALLPWKL